MHIIGSPNIANIARSLVFLVGTCSVAAPVLAQGTPAAELSFGYQLLNPLEEAAEVLDQGWYADGAYNVNSVVALVGQFGVNHEHVEAAFSNEGLTVAARGDAHLREFLGGVRLSARPRPSIAWFGQALVGSARASGNATVTATGLGDASSETFSVTTSNLALQLGGGMTARVAKHLGLRATLDSLRIFDDGESQSALRFTAGVVVGFGTR
jgi:hypothetical protein